MQVFKQKHKRKVAQDFLGWKYRDYLTNSWVGSCPELITRFHLARFPLYTLRLVLKGSIEIRYMDDVSFFG